MIYDKLNNSINRKKKNKEKDGTKIASFFRRKNLYVWNLETSELVKILDAHFARIIQLEALTVGNWNSVVTSSIDRSVKVWNINNIFEQVHVIDRHELQIDMIRYIEFYRLPDISRLYFLSKFLFRQFKAWLKNVI